MQKLLQDIHIGKRLKQLRIAAGLSQEEMVAKFELHGRIMSRSNYSHIEIGLRNIYVSDLILIKEILGVSFDDIFEGITSDDIKYQSTEQEEE